jgi:carotenoid cleavage dioxygenase
VTQQITNPYLSGNCAPVFEELTVETLEVIGSIPKELSGLFVRNGANPQFPPLGRYHWFDGDGMLHALSFANGKASYRNRYIRTEKFEAERAAGHALVPSILDMATSQIVGNVSMNTANTSVVWQANRLLTLWEGGAPHEVRVPSLETMSLYDFQGKLDVPFTAHPKVDVGTGEMLFFGYSAFAQPYLHYGVVSAEGEIVHLVPIDLPNGVMMHDFAVTEHFTIFMDLPLVFSFERALQGTMPFEFQANRPARFGILPRFGDNSSVRWFELPACWVWHTLNAYEEGDEVVLLACRANKANMLLPEEAIPVSNGRIPIDLDTISYMHRWRFNLSTGEVHEEQVDSVPTEFPRVNDLFMGMKTRYGYAARIPLDASVAGGFDALLKYDLVSGESHVHEFGAGRYGGEGVFAPKPDALAEDDGWLLTFVYDSERNVSECVILDAQHMDGEPVARVLLPQRVPYGFHGVWIGNKSEG